MYAYKIGTVVPPDHRVSITLPDSFPAGSAEIIFLAKTETSAAPSGDNDDTLGDEFWTNDHRLDTAAAGHLRTVTL